MNVALVVGARPNFMKATPVLHALERRSEVTTALVHTGQHYDDAMSESFLRDLGVRKPDLGLGVGSASHGKQTADVLASFEAFLLEQPQDLVVVFGDVNSTVAAALAAVKLHVPVAHVESGLRSGDRRMPEEINRILTDSMSALLFVTEDSGVRNLEAEGRSPERVHLVGNTMIDTLVRFRERVSERGAPAGVEGAFTLVTLHRPSNVDNARNLTALVEVLEERAAGGPVIWPVHPRTRARLEEFGLWERVERTVGMRVLPPASYLDFLAWMDRAALIVTDSGGIQEEALVLRTPVVTVRENTERPSTLEGGGNVLSGPDPARLRAAIEQMSDVDPASFRVPPTWDGHAGERIAETIVEFLGGETWL